MTIPIALSTGSVYTYGTSRAFELAASAGYDGVELIVDDRWDTRQATYLQRLVDQHGVPILSVHSPFSMLRIPGWPRPEVERISLALALAETVGARTLNLHVPLRVRDLTVGIGAQYWRLGLPGASPDQLAYRQWLTSGGLAALQAQTQVLITVENLPVRRVLGRRVNVHALNTWPELLAFPNLCLDTTHTGTTGADLLSVYAQLAPHVKHIHLSDFDGRRQHRPIGHGRLPLGAFLDAVAASAFAGVLVVELDPGGLPVHDFDQVQQEVRRCLDFCRAHLSQPQTGHAERSAASGPPDSAAVVVGNRAW